MLKAMQLGHLGITPICNTKRKWPKNGTDQLSVKCILVQYEGSAPDRVLLNKSWLYVSSLQVKLSPTESPQIFSWQLGKARLWRVAKMANISCQTKMQFQLGKKKESFLPKETMWVSSHYLKPCSSWRGWMLDQDGIVLQSYMLGCIQMSKDVLESFFRRNAKYVGLLRKKSQWTAQNTADPAWSVPLSVRTAV